MEIRSPHKKVLAFALMLVLVATGLLSFMAQQRFEESLLPSVEKKGRAVATSVSSLFTKLLGYGIPLESLVGVEDVLHESIESNREILYVAVTNRQGELLYYSTSENLTDKHADLQEAKADLKAISTDKDRWGRPYEWSLYTNRSYPISLNEEPKGVLHIGFDSQFVDNIQREILYDILTVLLISMLITFEILFFIANYAITGQLNAITTLMRSVQEGDFKKYFSVMSNDEIASFGSRFNASLLRINSMFANLVTAVSQGATNTRANIAQSIDSLKERYSFGKSDVGDGFFENMPVYIRPALFLLIFAESLSLSFFPMYVDQLYETSKQIEGLSKDVVIGLPISLFMLIWALSLPKAGMWSDRTGRKKSFVVGAVLTAVGLVLTGLATSMWDLLIWRSITAIGYGIVYMTCQGYITDTTTAKTRTRGMALFLAGFFSGSLCGSAIGGILADRIGFENTLFLSAGMAVVAAIFVYMFLRNLNSEYEKPVRGKLKLADIKVLVSNRYFLSLIVGTAIPAKMCLTGVLYYTGPMFLRDLGNNQSSIGRILLGYGLAIIFLSPFVGQLADRLGNRKVFVALGGLVASVSLVLVFYWQTTIGMFVAVSLIGLAHAIGVSPQIALILDACPKEVEKLGTGTVIGVFRFLERAGNVSGPILAGVVISKYGFQGVFVVMAGLNVIGILLFASSFFVGKGNKGKGNDGDKQDGEEEKPSLGAPTPAAGGAAT